MRMNKFYKVADKIVHGILFIFYLIFIFLVSSMFKFMPWYDEGGIYLLRLLLLWLPLSFMTIISVVIKFLTKDFNKAFVCIEALNAVYIPLIFLLGYVNIPLWVTQLIGLAGVITMIIYIVKIINKYIKNR